jgi:hypothetical protein
VNIQDAIDVIESVAGFTDESTPVGEAWLEVLSFIHRPTALAQPEPEVVTDEEIEREALKNADSDDEYRAFKSGAFFVQERISRPTIEPVPVAERPWEREKGWRDPDGECWWCPPDGPPYWQMANPAMVYGGWLLPAHALPVPGAEVG